MKENQTYAFTVNANDKDGDDLYFDINVKGGWRRIYK
jgi:hypothetical protein